MSRYTKVTVVGSARSADVVLPSDEPVGRLMGDVLRLLGDEPDGAARGHLLVRLDGTALESDSGLDDADIADGQLLRLVDVRDVPATPVVHDVTEAVAEDLLQRSMRWGAASRQWTCSAVTTASVLAAVVLMCRQVDHTAQLPLSWSVAGTFGIVGAVAARFVHRGSGVTLILAGAAVGGWAGLITPNGSVGASHLGWSAVAILGVVAAAAALLGMTSRVGRGGLIAGIVGLVVVGGWALGYGLDLQLPRLAAIAGVASVLALGLLPRLALIASGLTGMDDKRAGGLDVPRRSVVAALSAAHRTLALTVLVTASSAAVAGVVLSTHAGRWTIPLAALLCIVLASRSRMFPLTWQVVAVSAGAAAVAGGMFDAWVTYQSAWGAIIVLLVLAVIALLAPELVVPDHLRAWLRRIVDRLEAAATLAMLPVALGVFGVYGQLLHAV